MTETDISRRRFLRRAGWAGAAVAVPVTSGYVGYRLPRSTASTEQTPPAPAPQAADPTPDVHHFVSRPDLSPPRLTFTDAKDDESALPTTPGYLFLGPKGYQETGPGQQGCMLVDRKGRPVWLLPLTGEDEVPMDFRTQTYRGEPVLTWWQGTVHTGYGTGVGVIYDSSYRKVAEVRTGNGIAEADLHEFLLTDEDTALLVAYQPHRADLTAVGGPADGWLHSGVVQEVDVETGEVLFQWDSIDHVALTETEQKLGEQGSKDAPFDYFHINSAGVDADGDLLVSARNTCAIYKISRRDGSVVWRLGGTRSDFELGDGARFSWQHDARALPGDRLSLFDNASSPPRAKRSRGLILRLDPGAMRATVHREYVHPADLLADNQGSMQVLPEGRALVGWGAQPYTSEFSAEGELLADWRFPAPDQSYRAWAGEWTGKPVDRPAVAVQRNNARGNLVYASWNGATEVRRWRILAGPSAQRLEPVATMPRSGFETAVAVNADGPFFVAVALGEDGTELGRSDPIRKAG
ncbi:arylsulfotransferase family protein [Prauserella muralis]|uniref:ArsR family transcriptional regulator n=1 Tax=Prauserella muralis TaxID=588067 RepID=A0A2V4B011_9PSEU|nr:arylsulfotransferase family protein [Prauserella muralis]PXY27347.1 ArsR family transcriptional regulator [Prauserella muralis]TWE22969.1 secreted protein [Prauserella muralis]